MCFGQKLKVLNCLAIFESMESIVNDHKVSIITVHKNRKAIGFIKDYLYTQVEGDTLTNCCTLKKQVDRPI